MRVFLITITVFISFVAFGHRNNISRYYQLPIPYFFLDMEQCKVIKQNELIDIDKFTTNNHLEKDSIENKMKLVLQTGNTGKVNKIQFHPSQKFLLSIDSRNNIVIWDIAQRKQYTSYSFSDDFNDACFVNDTLIAVAMGAHVDFWDFTADKLIKRIHTKDKCWQISSLNNKVYYLSKGIYYLSNWKNDEAELWMDDSSIKKFYLSENGKYMATTKNNLLQVYDFSTKQLIGSKKLNCIHLQISDSLKVMSVATKDASVVNYSFEGKLKKVQVIVNNRKYKKYKAAAFSGNYGIVGNSNDIITIYNVEKAKILDNFKNKSFSIHSLASNPSGSLFAVGGESGVIKLYDFEKRILLSNLGGVIANVSSIRFCQDSVSILLGYTDGVLKKWNLKKHEIKTLTIRKSLFDKLVQAKYEIHGLNTNTPIASKFITTGVFKRKEKLKFYRLAFDSTFTEIKKKKLGKKDYFEAMSLTYPKTESSDLVVNYRNTGYRLKGSNEDLNIPSTTKILSAAKSLDGLFTLISADNGIIYLADNATGKTKLKLLSPGDNSFFYNTIDGYYFSSKSSLKSIGVRYDKMLLGFEQIDLLYNRPDKVLRALGYEDNAYLDLLKQAYFKRLDKLNVKWEELAKIENLPQVSSSLSSLPVITQTQEWSVSVKANGGKTELKSIHLLINGYPIFGKEGQSIWGKSVEQSIQFSLSPGENHIQLFVENDFGLKSLREDFHITLKTSYKPSLYLLAIGSGKFMDESYNLQYASKDANDVIKTFKEAKQFQSVHVQALVDGEVTKENVIKNIKLLEKAGPNDVVIVFFAGHGVLDNNLEYYLSTAEMDFLNPKQNGCNYNDLENAIGNLVCRNKIIFIDACHSGEVDKEELALNTANETEDNSDLVFRAAGVGVRHKAGASTFELSKNIFADLRQNTGVIVMSSAGGAEYAIEGGEWANGVFTYSLLSGLKNKDADIDGDKSITINELQKYLSVKVPELTNGRQTPTSRVENIEKDVKIW